jgi:hypothetical protein
MPGPLRTLSIFRFLFAFIVYGFGHRVNPAST